MSTISCMKIKCSVCGMESEQSVLTSTNAFGSPDLDLRPPEMRRSTMPLWIQECPHCTYISKSLENKTSISEDFLRSDEYRMCSNISFKSDLAKRFYRYYMIKLLNDNCYDAFYAVLHASWACDDVDDKDNAIHCRKLAIIEIEKLIRITNDETLKVQRADLLRRAGLFDIVINEYGASNFEDDTLQKIISFQIEKANQEDVNCYTVADAIK